MCGLLLGLMADAGQMRDAGRDARGGAGGRAGWVGADGETVVSDVARVAHPVRVFFAYIQSQRRNDLSELLRNFGGPAAWALWLVGFF